MVQEENPYQSPRVAGGMIKKRSLWRGLIDAISANRWVGVVFAIFVGFALAAVVAVLILNWVILRAIDRAIIEEPQRRHQRIQVRP
jgi:hypothetical protein